MAHWLFRQKNTSGAWKTPAKFIASWQSPWDDAPSPKYTIVTLSSPLLRLAHARPTACGHLARDRDAERQVPHPVGHPHPLRVPRVVEDEVLERPAAPHVRGPLAVVGHHPVRRAERVDAAEDRGLVAANGAEGADAPLPLEPEHPLVEAPGEKEGSVESAEVLGRNSGLERLVDATLLVNDGQMLDRRDVQSRPRHARPLSSCVVPFSTRAPLRVNLRRPTPRPRSAARRALASGDRDPRRSRQSASRSVRSASPSSSTSGSGSGSTRSSTVSSAKTANRVGNRRFSRPMRRVRSDTLRVYREGDGMAWLARRARPPGGPGAAPVADPRPGPLVHAGHVDGLHPAGGRLGPPARGPLPPPRPAPRGLRRWRPCPSRSGSSSRATTCASELGVLRGARVPLGGRDRLRVGVRHDLAGDVRDGGAPRRRSPPPRSARGARCPSRPGSASRSWSAPPS